MQDFRTGYYTLASPKALFTVQVCGAFLGVLYSPAVYTFYNHAFKSAPLLEPLDASLLSRDQHHVVSRGPLGVHGKGLQVDLLQAGKQILAIDCAATSELATTMNMSRAL